MAPQIRVAIIGLSTNAITDWASRVHLPYFQSAVGRSKYQIVALCNSSKEAAERSIKTYGLPAETRAYGSPQDLAADADVQLVVCCTRVDKHHETILPSIKAGKDVFVEWPFAQNAAKAEELTTASKASGSRTIVGLQGWHVPTTLKLKEIIASGQIGKVFSSDFRAARWVSDQHSVPSTLSYFADRKVGGNFVTIGFGHEFDWVQHVLGDLGTMQSRLQLQRPKLNVLDPTSGRTIDTVTSDVPDLVHMTASLLGSEHVVKDATLHMSFRRAPAFQGEPALVWTILGEKGEIRLTAVLETMLQVSEMLDVTIEVHDHEGGAVERVEFGWDSFLELPYQTRSYGPIYEAYAAGTVGSYADFEHALKRHEQLDGMLANWDASKAV
ncbi:hypothetical protein SLS62_003050 [Diatrype stigma]|uniref:Oxidoreductase n=1 Tax=Diatrype stigma TaxID=117547 RepID=A0AAN9UWS8_9PEZI